MVPKPTPGNITSGSLCKPPSVPTLNALSKASFWNIEHTLKLHARNEGHGYTNPRGRPFGKNRSFYLLCSSFGTHGKSYRKDKARYKTGCDHRLYFNNVSNSKKAAVDGPFKVDWGKSHMEHNHPPFEDYRWMHVPSVEERKMGLRVRGGTKRLKMKEMWDGDEDEDEDGWNSDLSSEEEEEDTWSSDLSLAEEEEDEMESDCEEDDEDEDEDEPGSEHLDEVEEVSETHRDQATQDQAAPSPIHLTDQVNIQNNNIAEEAHPNPNEEMLKMQERIEELQNRLSKAEVKRDEVERRNKDLQDRVDEMHEEREIEVERRRLEEAKWKLDEREKKLSLRKRRWGGEWGRGRAGEEDVKKVKIECIVIDDE
ncbi:hypothetical protein I302_107768 [Kwoniella bestiolae CBS 10118]|uniref:Uncharacterized protein n=1 Tax=Kwoniella bestiolae CBS 10118 TaxID=1296100 RepID=A0A1B9FXM9_9TREE|nr:hypothetical protein I302_06493 [Kwoniella bestiolae CBS 10118]OCF23510.1 hypothetical protein I302_06493 [Kwoniella bestiolae CBS 10118]